MVCIIRSAPSAEPRPWLGAIVNVGGGISRGLPTVLEAVRGLAPEWALAVDGDAAGAPAGLPVLAVAPGTGLAGCVLAGLDWTAARAAEAAWLLTVRGDAPVPDADLPARLVAAVSNGAGLVAVASLDGADAGIGLWPVDGRRALRRAIARDGPGAFVAWSRKMGPTVLEPSAGTPEL